MSIVTRCNASFTVALSDGRIDHSEVLVKHDRVQEKVSVRQLERELSEADPMICGAEVKLGTNEEPALGERG